MTYWYKNDFRVLALSYKHSRTSLSQTPEGNGWNIELKIKDKTIQAKRCLVWDNKEFEIITGIQDSST
jgi:hypothetical protein